MPPPTSSQASPAERSGARATLHLVRRDEWEATDGSLAYLPADFERDGFVHCTDGADEVAATANRYFADVKGDLLALLLDRARLLEMRRDASGAFLPPIQ